MLKIKAMVSEIKAAYWRRVLKDNLRRYERFKEHPRLANPRPHQKHVQSQRQAVAPRNGSLGSKKRKTH